MINTWVKEQIQTLKRMACSHREDTILEEKLINLNLHLSNYEKATLIHAKNVEWKEVEKIAAEMNERLLSLHAS